MMTVFMLHLPESIADSALEETESIAGAALEETESILSVSLWTLIPPKALNEDLGREPIQNKTSLGRKSQEIKD